MQKWGERWVRLGRMDWKYKGIVAELVTAMSLRVSSEKPWEDTASPNSPSKGWKAPNWPASNRLPLVKFHPLGHPLLHASGFQIHECWEIPVAYCILASTKNQGRELVLGLRIRWLPSGVVHDWYVGCGAATAGGPSVLHWQQQVALQGTSTSSCQGFSGQNTSQLHIRGLARKLACHFSFPMEVFTSYYYFHWEGSLVHMLVWVAHS